MRWITDGTLRSSMYPRMLDSTSQFAAHPTSARHLAESVGVAHRISPHACSKMPGGEGIAEFLFAAYLAYAVAVFALALGSAAWRARKPGANAGRIWLIHLTIALVATGAAPAFLIIDQQRSLRSAERTHREISAYDAVLSSLEFNPGQVSHALDTALAKLPPNNPYAAGALEDKAVARLQVPHLDWTAQDLDAFASLEARAQRINRLPLHGDRGELRNSNDLLVNALVNWYRAPASLPAAVTSCGKNQDCLERLARVEREWCATNPGRCTELRTQPEFRDAATALGLDLRVIAVDQFAADHACPADRLRVAALQNLHSEDELAVETPAPPENLVKGSVALTVWTHQQRSQRLKDYGFHDYLTAVGVTGCEVHVDYFCWEEYHSSTDDRRFCTVVDLENPQATFFGIPIDPLSRKLTSERLREIDTAKLRQDQ